MPEALSPSKRKFFDTLAEIHCEISHLQSRNERLESSLQSTRDLAFRNMQQMKQTNRGMQEYIAVLEAQIRGLRREAGYVDHPMGPAPEPDGH